MSSELWAEDANQLLYTQRNKEAIKKGAEIKRLFVLPRGLEDKFEKVVLSQQKQNVQVKIAYKDNPMVSQLPDMVLFEALDFKRLLNSNAAIDGTRQVLSGDLIVDEGQINYVKQEFNNAWKSSLDVSDIYPNNLKERKEYLKVAPPGESLEVFKLDHSVISCEEAAKARGIPLKNELKTLILETTSGLICVHISGDKKLELRKVKRFLSIDQACLANNDILLDMGMSPGTVSAVLDPVWSMPHLISKHLFDLEYVATNNGTRTAYFKFDPILLQQATNVQVGDFEEV